jgi:hypothetical protein
MIPRRIYGVALWLIVIRSAQVRCPCCESAYNEFLEDAGN